MIRLTHIARGSRHLPRCGPPSYALGLTSSQDSRVNRQSCGGAIPAQPHTNFAETLTCPPQRSLTPCWDAVKRSDGRPIDAHVAPHNSYVRAAREWRLRPRVNSQAIATATNMVSKLIGMDWLAIQATQVAMMIRMASSGYQSQFLRTNLKTSKAVSKRTNKTPTVRSVGAID